MQIDWEPDVTSRDISVAAHEGVITLTGFTPSYYEKMAAERAAKAVYGVKAVANDIEVKVAGTRSDPEIARDVVHAITADVIVPADRLKIGVKDGYVSLEGKVDWNFQRSAAGACADRIIGVRGVTNNITVKPVVLPAEVKLKIEEALKRSAEVDSRRINVSATEGTVYLTGNVRSWVEKEEAARAAWAAPGVSKVVDHIAVLP
jgi:osmotically-inducible protein OsmY